MPYVNGKYTNPGWKNGEAPPISADNLNDIGNALQNMSTENVHYSSVALLSDLSLFLSLEHPIQKMSPFYNKWEYKYREIKDKLKRTVNLTGDAQTLTLYDGGDL